MAELSDIIVDGNHTQTIAVEADNAEAVAQSVTELGLNGYVNTSFPNALSALARNVPERYAVIDIGTNSVKFLLAERHETGRWKTLLDLAEVTRLGEGVAATGTICEAAVERTIEALAAMVEEAKHEEVRAIVAVGTAALRKATNASDVVRAIEERARIAVEVITGDQEADLAYKGARSTFRAQHGSFVVFETGGGSSQFTFVTANAMVDRFSINVGAAKYTEQFKLDRSVSSDAWLAEAMTAISADLAKLDNRSPPDVLIGLGGAVTNLAAVYHALATYDPRVIEGTVLDRTIVDKQIELYRTRNADDRRSIIGLQKSRAEVILAGACIVRCVMAKLGMSRLVVSDKGLRHGVLEERFGYSENTAQHRLQSIAADERRTEGV